VTLLDIMDAPVTVYAAHRAEAEADRSGRVA